MNMDGQIYNIDKPRINFWGASNSNYMRRMKQRIPPQIPVKVIVIAPPSCSVVFPTETHKPRRTGGAPNGPFVTTDHVPSGGGDGGSSTGSVRSIGNRSRNLSKNRPPLSE